MLGTLAQFSKGTVPSIWENLPQFLGGGGVGSAHFLQSNTTSFVNDIFSCNILAGDALAFTLKKICGQMLSDHLGKWFDGSNHNPSVPLHLYLVLSTCDPNYQDAF